MVNAAPEVTGADGLVTLQDGPISNLQKFYRVALVGAVRSLPTTGHLTANDDGSSSSTIPVGFTVNFFGTNRSAVWVNNNGNITFDTALATWTPLPLQSNQHEMIAPFWGDVDTRPGATGDTSWSSGVFIGLRHAFAVTWPHVGYYDRNTNKHNTFQLVLIERSDIATGDFDIELNYDKIQWETGDAPSSGGVNGLGGKSARVGISNGSDRNVELAGSGVNGQLLDSALITGLIYNSRNSAIRGRYVFQVRSGVVLDAIQVSAGDDQALAVGAGSTGLSGSATDPNGGSLTYQWAKLIGPGTVTFSNAAILNPTATFSTTGAYTLQLTATSNTDSQRTAADVVVITVQ